MGKFKFLSLLLVGAISFGLISCSNDDEPGNNWEDDPVQMQDYHFDLWVALEKHGGMSRKVTILVQDLPNLDADQPTINFEGKGATVSQTMTLETIVKGAYYYQVPVSGDCFGKYRIVNNQIQTVAERRFQTNTYSASKYSHAWIDDKTLVIMAADGTGKNIVWSKLDANNMSLISEGTLGVSIPSDGIDGIPANDISYTTSGILAYRESDDKLFYFYYLKKGSGRTVRISTVQTAVINPKTMAVEEVNSCPIDCEMSGSSYGELLQTITFVDNDNNLYLACFSDTSGSEVSYLLRIPAGATNFDPNYNGYKHDGKLISIEYLGGNTAVAYARNDALGTNIDDFSHYYCVLNLATSQATPLKYNGTDLAYSSGRFSSRMAHVNGKAYVGIDPQSSNPQIFIYDAKTGQVTKGAEMAPGYYFEQIRVIENLKN